MKPIEAGCLAIIVKATVTRNIGKSVTVVSRMDDDWWFVEGDVETISGNIGCGVCREKNIIRIDDYDPSTEETTIDREVTA